MRQARDTSAAHAEGRGAPRQLSLGRGVSASRFGRHVDSVETLTIFRHSRNSVVAKLKTAVNPNNAGEPIQSIRIAATRGPMAAPSPQINSRLLVQAMRFESPARSFACAAAME